jgi:hypothetical protein
MFEVPHERRRIEKVDSGHAQPRILLWIHALLE